MRCITQQYSLSPNPSDGRVTLKQAVADNEPVQAEIWNSTGERVYDGQFHFEGGITGFTMLNKVPGLYLLQLTDNNGTRFMLKFVINDK